MEEIKMKKEKKELVKKFKVLIEDIKYLYYEVGRRRREIDEYIINKNHKRM